MMSSLYIRGCHKRTEKPVQHQEKMHSHECYEIYCILSGDADYCVEGSRYRLQSGDIMLMRKGEVHIFHLRSTVPYERMYVQFDIQEVLESADALDILSMFNDRALGKFNHYQADMFPNNRWKEHMANICHADTQQKRLCYLMPLLNDLAECFESVKTAPLFVERDRTAQIIKFINANLTGELSLDVLADQFFISKMHLNRIFRRSTGTTPWEYITLKRLLLAKALIDEGRNPTAVFQQCGFRDYTTFFRSYKRHFGVSPKEHSTVSSK